MQVLVTFAVMEDVKRNRLLEFLLARNVVSWVLVVYLFICFLLIS